MLSQIGGWALPTEFSRTDVIRRSFLPITNISECFTGASWSARITSFRSWVLCSCPNRVALRADQGYCRQFCIVPLYYGCFGIMPGISCSRYRLFVADWPWRWRSLYQDTMASSKVMEEVSVILFCRFVSRMLMRVVPGARSSQTYSAVVNDACVVNVGSCP